VITTVPQRSDHSETVAVLDRSASIEAGAPGPVVRALGWRLSEVSHCSRVRKGPRISSGTPLV
jgi:hypothetical protein